MAECLYIEFKEELQFFNENGVNDITLQVSKEYVAFREQERYRVKLKDGNELYIPCNSESLCDEFRVA